jgi:hypothetical protein
MALLLTQSRRLVRRSSQRRALLTEGDLHRLGEDRRRPWRLGSRLQAARRPETRRTRLTTPKLARSCCGYELCGHAPGSAAILIASDIVAKSSSWGEYFVSVSAGSSAGVPSARPFCRAPRPEPPKGRSATEWERPGVSGRRLLRDRGERVSVRDPGERELLRGEAGVAAEFR